MIAGNHPILHDHIYRRRSRMQAKFYSKAQGRDYNFFYLKDNTAVDKGRYDEQQRSKGGP